MAHYYWNDWYSGWGWFLWFGVILLFFSNVGTWGYTYRAHRKYDEDRREKNAIDLLNERYARGEIKREEYFQIRNEISRENPAPIKKSA